MRIKISLAICLSLFLLSCGEDPSLPPRPDGLHCTYFAKKFYCNKINSPDEKYEFDVDSIEMEKAQCMPLETFERYSSYVQELKDLARKKCEL